MKTTPSRGRRPPPPRRPKFSLEGLWHNTSFRGLLYQAIVVIAVIGSAIYMGGNAQHALAKRGIQTGFDFLFVETGFPIGETLIRYSSQDTYLRAFWVAVLNTLSVSAASVVGATIIGVVVGIARLSKNVLVARLASIYVELLRNTPQLLQMAFWYLLITRLPIPRQAFNLFDTVFTSNRGFYVPWPVGHPLHVWIAAAFGAGCAAAFMFARSAEKRRRRTGIALPLFPWCVALVVVPASAVWWFGGAPAVLSVPKLQGFNFVGGRSMSPEFVALFLGLSLYIGAFLAEIVRAGIQSAGRGQIEAALSIGLSKVDLFRRIILPQALRIMVPPAGAQYVSLVKNSSLGVAVGYPELFNITNTSITMSGHTLECIGLMAIIYLTIAFTIAIAMNLYNRVIQIKEH